MEERSDIERLARIETLVEETYKKLDTLMTIPTELATLQGIVNAHEARLLCLEQAKNNKNQIWYAAIIAAVLSFIGNWFWDSSKGG